MYLYLFLLNSTKIVKTLNQSILAHIVYGFLKYVAIPVLLLIMIIVIFSLIFNRFIHDRYSGNKIVLDSKINIYLTDLIFTNYTETETFSLINDFKNQTLKKNKQGKYLILNKLIHIKETIKDVNPNLILVIYKEFGLDKYSKKLLEKERWFYKSLAFYHYQSLEYRAKKEQILPYLGSRNKYLKSNALIAIISLSEGRFNFLNDYQDPISRTDEIKILDLIYHRKATIPENIKIWLDSKNYSIVALAVKLIIYYREGLTNEQIEKLLKIPDKSVRKVTILAVRDLYLFGANLSLMNHFNHETDFRNKISVLKTLGVIGNIDTIDFAIDLLNQENNFDLKFEIISCIQNIDGTFFNDFQFETQHENDVLKRIILHNINPYLK